jgi:isoleucyl-tRNA synthetase
MEKTGLRKQALEALDTIAWVPPWGKDRMLGMLKNRPDWCISRQRSWGVPIAFYLCKACDTVYDEPGLRARTLERFAKEGADTWFKRPDADFLGDAALCPSCGSKELRKETDILDVWFDSGMSHAYVSEVLKDFHLPADLYLEGSDQHRGWFHSSLLIALLRESAPPYRAVLTHGFVVDEKGRKMSKSLGNVLDPNVLIKQHGAEILRLWTSYEDYKNDIRVSDTIISQLVDVYRRIRNTCRFLLANLYDFDPTKDAGAYETLPLTERFMLQKLFALASNLKEAYEAYEFHAVVQQLHQFCALDLSAFYLDISKDALYCLHPTHPKRRAIQTVLHETLEALLPMMAPILSFTAEEVFEHIPYCKAPPPDTQTQANGPASVFFLDFPTPKPVPMEEGELAAFKAWLDLRTHALKALEMARKEKGLKSNLDAILAIELPKGFPLPQTLPGGSVPLFEELFITSGVLVGPQAKAFGEPLVTHHPETQGGLVVHALRSPHPKCERCWKHKPEVGKAHSSLMVCARCLEELGQVGLP